MQPKSHAQLLRDYSIPDINARGIRSHALAATAGILLGNPLNRLLAQCGTSILRSMVWEIGPRRWRLGLFFGPLDLGGGPGVAPGWYGPGGWPAPLRAPDAPTHRLHPNIASVMGSIEPILIHA